MDSTEKRVDARLRADAMKRAVLYRARNRCEGSPKYPDCRAKDGQAHPETDKPVTLRVINLVPGTDDINHKRAWCERCLLSYDFPAHSTHDWRSRRQAMMNNELFPIEDPNKGKP